MTTNSTCGSRDADEVLLGVDTHLDFHVAVVLDILGRRLGEWHFHPGGPPEASLTDVKQMGNIARSPSYRYPEPILLLEGGSAEGHSDVRGFVFVKKNRRAAPIELPVT